MLKRGSWREAGHDIGRAMRSAWLPAGRGPYVCSRTKKASEAGSGLVDFLWGGTLARRRRTVWQTPGQQSKLRSERNREQAATPEARPHGGLLPRSADAQAAKHDRQSALRLSRKAAWEGAVQHGGSTLAAARGTNSKNLSRSATHCTRCRPRPRMSVNMCNA